MIQVTSIGRKEKWKIVRGGEEGLAFVRRHKTSEKWRKCWFSTRAINTNCSSAIGRFEILSNAVRKTTESGLGLQDSCDFYVRMRSEAWSRARDGGKGPGKGIYCAPDCWALWPSDWRSSDQIQTPRDLGGVRQLIQLTHSLHLGDLEWLFTQ